jgi:hypothetical protein
MTLRVTFKKTGQEIQDGIANRITALQARLDRRNQSLEELLDDRAKLRSYLVRSSQTYAHHGGRGEYMLVSEEDISSEEKEEIDQMLRRIFEIEQEIRRLKLIAQHIVPTDTFELEFNDLVSYGFDAPDM